MTHPRHSSGVPVRRSVIPLWLSLAALAALVAASIGVSAPSAHANVSDAPTPYSVGLDGITLPSGDTFQAHGHVNIRTSTGQGYGVHFDPNNNHPGGAWIGQGFIPWSAFGLDPDTVCVSWVQISHYNQHFGEGGQDPVGKGCVPTPTPDPSPDPVPTPEPTPDPTPTPEPSPTPDPSPTPTPEPSPEPEPGPKVTEGEEVSAVYICDSPPNGLAISTITVTPWTQIGDGDRIYGEETTSIDTVSDPACDYLHPPVVDDTPVTAPAASVTPQGHETDRLAHTGADATALAWTAAALAALGTAGVFIARRSPRQSS